MSIAVWIIAKYHIREKWHSDAKWIYQSSKSYASMLLEMRPVFKICGEILINKYYYEGFISITCSNIKKTKNKKQKNKKKKKDSWWLNVDKVSILNAATCNIIFYMFLIKVSILQNDASEASMLRQGIKVLGTTPIVNYIKFVQKERKMTNNRNCYDFTLKHTIIRIKTIQQDHIHCR